MKREQRGDEHKTRRTDPDDSTVDKSLLKKPYESTQTTYTIDEQVVKAVLALDLELDNNLKRATKELEKKHLEFRKEFEKKHLPYIDIKVDDAPEVNDDWERARENLLILINRHKKIQQAEEARKRKEEWRKQLINEEEAKAQADLLHELYGIQVEIVKTDKDYHLEATFLRTIKEKVYFISEESPIETCMATEVLIRQHKLRTELMHANRVEKAAENKKSLAEKIAEIRTAYIVENKGKEPSVNKLASLLTDKKIESPSGKKKWYGETVKRVLAGDASHHSK